jgi:hypothetical protein
MDKMEKGKFAITMKIEFDLSEEGAVEEFALMMAKIRDAGYPEFAEQVAQGIQSEGVRLGFIKKQ